MTRPDVFALSLSAALSLAVISLLARPASSAPVAGDYQVEATIVTVAGEWLAAPKVPAVAHEPAEVTLPVSHDRTLRFWALVKPLKDRPDCQKIMVKVVVKGAVGEPYTWGTELFRMCGDEPKVFSEGRLVTTVRVLRPTAPPSSN